jgi:hypothetical protein
MDWIAHLPAKMLFELVEHLMTVAGATVKHGRQDIFQP